MRVAIVHDWLVTYAGAEKVLEEMLKLYPDADLFSLIDFLPEGGRGFILDKPVHTSFIQKLPLAKTKYRHYLPLMPLAIEQLDLSAYDLVLSSSYAVAKGVITGPDQLHISYVHSPIRYAWDLQHQYLREAGLERGVKSWLARLMLHRIRLWDARTASGVDHFVTNSRFIARRVFKVYRREAAVIHPPVDVSAFGLGAGKEDFYLTASRLVPYKRIDLIVEAFREMPERRLVVIGDGPERGKIARLAGSNVTLLGYQPFEVLRDHLQRARAFVFAAEEDFGIVPVEAQACGTPVIAYGKGGALETVRGLETGGSGIGGSGARGPEAPSPTGVFFAQQTPEAVRRALETFEAQRDRFAPSAIREHALRFGAARFREELQHFVEARWQDFRGGAIGDETSR